MQLISVRLPVILNLLALGCLAFAHPLLFWSFLGDNFPRPCLNPNCQEANALLKNMTYDQIELWRTSIVFSFITVLLLLVQGLSEFVCRAPWNPDNLSRGCLNFQKFLSVLAWMFLLMTIVFYSIIRSDILATIEIGDSDKKWDNFADFEVFAYIFEWVALVVLSFGVIADAVGGRDAGYEEASGRGPRPPSFSYKSPMV